MREPPYSTNQIIKACFPTTIVAGGKLPSGVDELVKLTPDGPVIMYSRALSGPEQRFAIAHALAHVLFDDARARMRAGYAGDPVREARADMFAVELLAPVAELVPRIEVLPSENGDEHEIYLDSVDVIASVFGLPAAVIDARIRDLIVTHKIVSQL